MQKRTISVIANPFHVIDQNNRPACVVPVPGVPGRYIGALLDDAATAATRSDVPAARTGGKAVFKFMADADGKLLPQQLPAEPAFLGGIANSILDGALIACDAESAAMVGISAKSFKDPYVQLGIERGCAVERVKAEGRSPGQWATDDKFFAPAAEPKPEAEAQAEQPKAEAKPEPKQQRKSAEKDSTQ